ncbi:MAG TPA: indole-3-glycerol phosphate synthase TrpC [Dysgonamonadaceae bacterium]|nr:indole-3-glycerol phosphate synthase TrpC [Dysgonamonadaceae bacterium]
MKDVLSEIIAHKKIEVESQKKLVSIKDIEKKIGESSYRSHSLKDALLKSSNGIIAEFKRKSPSKSWINKEADASIIPLEYENNGAAALSILTDEVYFGGTMNDLQKTIALTSLPVLRKEFIVDEYQLFEAKMFGAHAILLIAAALTSQKCKQFTQTAQSIGLEVLLELHDESEIEHVSSLNNMIGINNRNLGTFETTVEKSFKMIDTLPKEAVLISESGISDPETVYELRQAGFSGFLIGENFMKSSNPGEALKQFISGIHE